MFASLVTDRLILRELRPSDAEAMYAYRSDPEVARYQNWEPGSLEEIQGFIAGLSETAPGQPGAWYQVGIALRESDRLIGDLGIHVSSADPRQAEIGITLAPAFQGRGLASEALRALFGFLFSDLGLHRLHGSVDPRNTASMALLARVGMRQEAHFIESYWCKGEWTDDAIFALLEREWLAAQP